MTINFEHLMQEAQAGDIRAYQKLLKACVPLISKIVYQKINIDAEDVIQDTLISLHKARHTYQPDKPFKPWLYAICRYRIADALRKRYRAPETTELSETISSDVTFSSSNSAYIHATLKKLPETQQMIIIAMKRDGYTAAEVALHTGMSVNAVKVASHRGIKKLKKLMEGIL